MDALANAAAPSAPIDHHHQQQHQESEDDDDEEEVCEADREETQVLNQLSDMNELMQDGTVEIPKELILVSLVAKEQSLYNPKHENYRKPHCKDIKWEEIAETVGWTELQCKAKWKAMRDQYCRELKRSKVNMKAIVKWKHFQRLDFLRPYALSRNYRPRNTVLTTINRNNISSNNNLAIANTYHSSNGCNGDATTNNNHIKIATPQFQTCEYSVTAASTTVVTTTAGSTIGLPMTLSVAQVKSETSCARIIASITDEQVNSVIQEPHQQEGNWNYLPESVPGVAAMTTVSSCHNDLATSSAGNASLDDVLYSAYVECPPAPNANHQNDEQNQEEDDTEEENKVSIHAFLHSEADFERNLIESIKKQGILYNSFHPNYRNVKMKVEVWQELALKLDRTMQQCRLKWKALRDQFIREHKRLKSRENPESLPRWKHYDALSFLHKFIKPKSCDFEAKTVQIEISKMTEADIEEHNVYDSALELSTPASVFELHQQQPSLELHQQQSSLEQHQQQSSLELHQQQLSLELHRQQPSLELHQQQSSLELHQQQSALKLHQQQSSLELHTLSSLTGVHAQEQQLQQQAVGNICASSYVDMDIDSYIIGDAIDEDVDEDEDIDEDHKSQQQFPDYVHSTKASNNVQQVQQQHENSSQNISCIADNENDKCDNDGEDIKCFDVMKAMRETIVVDPEQKGRRIMPMDMDVAITGVTLPKSSTVTIASTSASITPAHSDTTQIGGEDSLQQQLILNNQLHHQQQHCTQKQMQQQPLPEFHTVAEASLLNGVVISNGIHNNSNSHMDGANIDNGVLATGGSSDAITTDSSTSAGATFTNHDDDEVAVFFRAVAMKIRSAKMSPVAFTELQIAILRVINGTLRH